MRLSPFFAELSSSYAYEIEDLTWDSGGGNVLKSRLRIKREQFADLLPMSESFPVMVVPAFHGGFRFTDKATLERLIATQPDDFPTWKSLSEALDMEPWASELARRALQNSGGDQLMLIAAGLEYIQSGQRAVAAVAALAEAESATLTDPVGEDAEDSGDEPGDDLGEAGEDYLSEQGFDRRS